MMQESMRETTHRWWQGLKEDTYTLIFLGALLVVLAGFGAWKARSWYVQSKEGAAQMAFSQALDEYNQAVSNVAKGSVEQKQWDDAAFAFKDMQEKHPSTTYALYAQVFQADILAMAGKLEEGIALLQDSLRGMKTDAPGYYLFSTKIALMMFDAKQTEDAVSRLKDLAHNPKNTESDTAAFFLGYYYWTLDDVDNARAEWSRFEAGKQPEDAQKVSPWASIAQVKLAQLL